MEAAAKNGDAEEVGRLLEEEKEHPDAVNGFDMAALMFAAVNGRTECVGRLVCGGAALDLQQVDGWSALHLAARQGHLEVCRVLVGAGASVAVQDKDGDTPLHWAARWGHLEVCRLLVEGGASVLVKNYNSQTALEKQQQCRHLQEQQQPDATSAYLRSL